MPVKLASVERPAKDKGIKFKEAMPVLRSGGESRPFEYPHLYRIQAGDWRISYAVEHNRLAILVLEVLNPDGTSEEATRKDETPDTVKRTMKVKLLDWPEGSPSRDLPPDEVGKKLKIKFLDLADEITKDGPEAPRAGANIKLAPTASTQSEKSRITFVDATARPAPADEEGERRTASKGGGTGKVTPLDGPTL